MALAAGPTASKRRAQHVRVAGADVVAPGRRRRDVEAVAGGAHVERRVERLGRPHEHLDRLAAAVERPDLARHDLAQRRTAEEGDRIRGALAQAIHRFARREPPRVGEVRDPPARGARLRRHGRHQLDVERTRRAPAQPQLALAGVRLDAQRERAAVLERMGLEHAAHALRAAAALERRARSAARCAKTRPAASRSVSANASRSISTLASTLASRSGSARLRAAAGPERDARRDPDPSGVRARRRSRRGRARVLVELRESSPASTQRCLRRTTAAAGTSASKAARNASLSRASKRST